MTSQVRPTRPPLPDYPALAALPALRAALRHEGRAVFSAPPGSGKTTTLPLALLDEPWLAGQKIVLLEPRRVAARAAAARLAALLGEKVGETVGYQIRHERRIGPATRIEVVTEGLLTRRLLADAELPGVGLVIFDEFHERSLDADLALALTLDARENLRPELRVLVMSATLDIERVARLLRGADGAPAPRVEAGGTLFPIDLRYRPPRSADAPLDETVSNAVFAALTDTPGDVLVFLPGAREIRAVQRRLEERSREVRVLPLYGELPSEQQDAALAYDPQGPRKVILATNIAQTSLTVEGVTTVVDAGLVRVARFDLGAGANRLITQKVSRASADQRSGRAGRLGPGFAYRLWSAEQQGRLAAHDVPEILGADLTRLALDLAVWGVTDPAALALLDPPAPAQWRHARELLAALGAVDTASGRITPHGRALARLPTAPRRAHLLVRAQALGLTTLAAWTAAVLDERLGGGTGADLADAVQGARAGRGDPAFARRVREAATQLLRGLDDRGAGERANAADESDDFTLGRLVAFAYPERIARRREGLREGARISGPRELAWLTADGGEARLPETDPLAKHEWLAIAHWDADAPRRIRLAAPLREADVLADHAERVTESTVVRWQAQEEAVQAERQRRLGRLVLSAQLLREPGAAGRAQVTAALLDGARAIGLHALPWSPAAREWQARVLSLRHWLPEGFRESGSEPTPWPDASDEALLATLEDWLAPHLDGLSRRSHLDRFDLMTALQGLLSWPQQQALARLAPTHLTVPSGNRHALAYQPGQAPVLEVKLQELFGATDTPTVCDGRVRVVLHLLSPGRKPVAVTGDLASFWARSYFEVKKDLRGRYPRHPWPDDPLAAQATARAKPRGT